MRLRRSLTVTLIVGAALWSARLPAADISWDADRSLHGLDEVRLIIMTPEVTVQSAHPLQPLIRDAVRAALKKAGVEGVLPGERPTKIGTPVFRIYVRQIDDGAAKPPVFLIDASVTDYFRIMRDPKVVGTVITWSAGENRVLSGDPETTILRGVDALMARFVVRLNLANTETDDPDDDAGPGGRQ